MFQFCSKQAQASGIAGGIAMQPAVEHGFVEPKSSIEFRINPNKSSASGGFSSPATVAFERRHFPIDRTIVASEIGSPLAAALEFNPLRESWRQYDEEVFARYGWTCCAWPGARLRG
jgi:hypothetical protein